MSTESRRNLAESLRARFSKLTLALRPLRVLRETTGFAALAGKESPFPDDSKWNFTKFLIGRDGTILKRFDSKTTPDSSEVIAAIESTLAAK